MPISCGLGQIQEGKNQLAGLVVLGLLEKFQTMVWLPRVYTCIYGFIKLWTVHQCDTMESMSNVHHTGLKEGNSSEVSQVVQTRSDMENIVLLIHLLSVCNYQHYVLHNFQF